MKRAIVIAVLVALFVPFYTHAKKKRVPPSLYTIVINENGFDSLWFGGARLATGGLQLIDGSWFYQPFVARQFEPTIVTKSFSQNGNSTVVNHVYTGPISANITYTYVISVDDLSIQAAVTNTGGSPITIPAFRSPYFLWDSLGSLESNGLNFDQSHTQHNGPILSYPSVNAKFSATYVIGLGGGGFQLNLCTWSKEDPFSKFFTLAYGTSPVFGGRALGNFFFDEIPAGNSKTFKFAFRFSTSTDWKVLMQPYKEDLRQRFPTVAYKTDARPMAFFASINTAYVRPDNPYGYNDGGGGVFRRFDKLIGCQDYLAKLVPPMLDTNYQGIILWQPQGINSRGVQYRPDFDIFPAVTYANLPTLVNGFRNAGLSIGILARPGQQIVATSPTTDGLVPFATLQDAVADIQPRLAWALGQGFNGWYIDSFVNSGYDHDLMKGIRDAIGDAQTFCEHSTALSVPFSSIYHVIGYANGSYFISKEIPILRWIYPECILITQFSGSLPPGGYAELYAYMFANKLTPLIEDHRAMYTGPANENDVLRPLVQTYIDSNNQWRLGAVRADASPRQRSTNRQIAVNRGLAVDRQ